MPHFFVDDAFSDSKEVLAIPARHRLSAVGLWTLCGSWSSNKLTDGRVPNEVLKMLGGRPVIVDALVDFAGLWERDSNGIRFTNWSKWQRTRDQVVSYRQAQADKKQKQREAAKAAAARANQEMSPGDNMGDANSCPPGTPQTPIPIPKPEPLSTYVFEESSLNVGGDERGLSEPVNPSASRLVAKCIPHTIPASVQTGLRLSASQLMNGDGVSADVITEALKRWMAKPGAGHGLLPSLVADVVRERASPAPIKPHKVRALANLANEIRAQELAEAAQQKELE